MTSTDSCSGFASRPAGMNSCSISRGIARFTRACTSTPVPTSTGFTVNVTNYNSAYAFNRLTKPANVLVMPAIHSAAISTKLVQALGGATVIGPLLVGLEKPVQIVSLGASVSEIITAATFAAYDAGPAFQGSGLTSAPRPPAAVVER